MPPSIYDYIKKEESDFETSEVQLGDNWFWNMRRHIQLIFHLKNGIFFTGENNWLRAFKNIMEPILHLSYWTEDLEVKDVNFYTEGDDSRVLPFLIKKYHDEVYAKDHDLDALFDEITESDLDYGGVLVQKGSDIPEVLQFNSLAFCDQTDILGSPFAFKMSLSPEKLRDMSKLGWGETKNGANITLDELCTLATQEKDPVGTMNKKQNRIPGKTIDVYITIGNLPDAYLTDSDDMEYFCNQLQIVAYYVDKDSQKQGVTLYRKKYDESNVKFFTSQKIHGRGLGRGVGETLLSPQIWTNFLTIHKMNMLEASSKVPLYTDDPTYSTKNKIQDMENLEITVIEDGKVIRQVPTGAPVNVQLLDNAVNEWYNQAQLGGSAFDPILGGQAKSGTTFRGQERSVSQGQGLHERRRGQRARFIEQIYQDWIIPNMAKEILNGKKFVATLSAEELNWIAETVSTNLANEAVKNMILAGKYPTPDEQAQITQTYKQTILKKGSKQLLEILKGEFKDVDLKVGVSVSNKRKDMGMMVDNLNNIIKTIMSNPYMLKSEPILKLFNQMVEGMGLDPIDLTNFTVPLPLPARRVTESIDYKDLQPNEKQAMLEGAGIQVQPDQAQPSPIQNSNIPVNK